MSGPPGPVAMPSGRDSQTTGHHAVRRGGPRQVAEFAFQRGEHGVPFPLVDALQEFDVPLVSPALQQLVDDELRQVVRTEIVVPLQPSSLFI